MLPRACGSQIHAYMQMQRAGYALWRALVMHVVFKILILQNYFCIHAVAYF